MNRANVCLFSLVSALLDFYSRNGTFLHLVRFFFVNAIHIGVNFSANKTQVSNKYKKNIRRKQCKLFVWQGCKCY